MESLDVYIPMDRRQAMVRGQELPDRAQGAALFADISGFTPLTEALVHEFGPRRGADELTRQLNQIYDALITEVHRYGGSVISFGGDAIICWFDGDNGLRATTCALAMQAAMSQVSAWAESTPSVLDIPLAIKAGVACGPVRRFLVGDPHIRYLDILAGATVDLMGQAGQQANKNEVVVGSEIISLIGDQVVIAAWRPEQDGPPSPGSEQRFAVVTGLTSPPINVPTSVIGSSSATPLPLTEAQIRPWLLAPVYERLKAGRGMFLAELRTAVALFLRFGGLDYDLDDAVGQKLDAYICWVQNVLAHYEGYLIEVTIGDKGSSIYGVFGAPLAPGDDAARAVAAALQLQTPPPELGYITNVQIGLSQGQMRAGPYGSSTRRAYGIHGSEVNAAARLMDQAEPGQVLISKRIAEAAAKNYDFEYLKPVQVKGLQEPIPVYRVLNRRLPTPERLTSLVMRQEALQELEQVLEIVLAGQEQILRLEGVAGVGQSHLTADFVQRAHNRGFQVARGICRSPAPGNDYAPWRQIFRAWFDLADEPLADQDPAEWSAQQLAQVQDIIKDINLDWLSLLPLLNRLLDLDIPDNAATSDIEPALRRGIFLALTLEMIDTWTQHRPTLLLIEDAHWLDEASQELTLALARSVVNKPILLTLVHQPQGGRAEPLLPELNQLPGYNYLNLHSQTPFALYRHHPSGQTPTTAPAGDGANRPALNGKSDTVGREVEHQKLTGQLQALLDHQASSLIIIEGEAGIGKSQLITDLLKQAHAMGVTSLIGAGDAIEKSTPYHAWRPVFRQLFDLDVRPGANTITRRTQTLSLLPTDPELLRLAPLLNAVLPLKLQENDVTRHLRGQARADNTHELLTRLLQGAATRSPTLLILEDAHWLDSASWALTRLVSRRIQPVLLVIATRPMAEPLPSEFKQLQQTAGVQRLQLEALTPEEALSIVCQRLGVNDLPEPVAALIRAKTGGHPFFSEEMAYALRDAGLIRISNGRCQLASGINEFSTINLPDTIEDVITSRIDRLRPAHQLLLKVASVVGQVFSVRVLTDIHPVTVDKPRLPDYLNTLERLDITMLERPEPDLAYVFKHAITQEVAYNLMLFEQRMELHQAVAEWFERTYNDDLSPFYPLLAHHWSRAVLGGAADPGRQAKAIDYLEKAGEKALLSYANQEAVRFFSEALSLEQTATAPARETNGHSRAAGGLAPPSSIRARLRGASWKRMLGQAHLGLGNLVESRRYLEQALARLGWPVPTKTWPLLLDLLRQVLQQFWHRIELIDLMKSTPEQQAVWLEAARANERLGETHYWSNQTAPAIHSVLRTLNFAERAGPSPELARAYANMCLVVSFISQRALAESYARRAQDVARALRHQPALAWVLEVTGIYAIGVGQWATATSRLDDAAALSRQLKDQRRWEECLTALGDIQHLQGQFAASARLWPDIYDSARRRGDAQAQSWSLAGQLRTRLILDQLDTADGTNTLKALELLLSENIGSADEINSYGSIALATLRCGKLDLARQAVDVAAQLIAQSSPTGYGIIHGYSNVTEVYLALWEAEVISDMCLPILDLPQLRTRSPTVEVQELKSNARQACQFLHKYARGFPIGRPRAWLWQGLYDWLTGQSARARQAWQRSLNEAERLGMVYEQGQAHYQIGRHLALTEPARQIHLARAVRIFDQLEAAYALKCTRAALMVEK